MPKEIRNRASVAWGRKGGVLPLSSILLAMAAMSGCATRVEEDAASDARTVFIGPELPFRLPEWRTPDRPVDAVQRLTGTFGGQTVSVQVRVSITDSGLEAVGLDAFGRRGFRIRWNADGIAAQRAEGMPETVKPGNVLADIVFAHWPADILGAVLEPQGFSLRETPGERDILREDKPIVHVSYGVSARDAWNGNLTLSNRPFGYEIAVDSREIH